MGTEPSRRKGDYFEAHFEGWLNTSWLGMPGKWNRGVKTRGLSGSEVREGHWPKVREPWRGKVATFEELQSLVFCHRGWGRGKK